ncbi:hypothetical protein V2W45_1234055, partial [Cenococcum geophilum]
MRQLENAIRLAEAREGQQQALISQQGGLGARPNGSMMSQTSQAPQMSAQIGNTQSQMGPMQASPIPMSQGQSSTGIDASNQMVHQQLQSAPQIGMQRNQRPGQMPNPLSDEKITQFAAQLMKSAKPKTIERAQAEVQRMPPEKRQELERRGVNPMLFVFRHHALIMAQNKRQQALISQQGGLGARPNGSMMSQTSQAPQIPAQQMGNTQSQMGVMGGNQDFDYAQLALQQAEASRVQDQGQLIIPVSNNPNANQAMGAFGSVGTPQPGQVSQLGQPQNAAAQRQAAFANAQ